MIRNDIKERFIKCSIKFCKEFNLDNIPTEIIDIMTNDYCVFVENYISFLLKNYNLPEYIE